MKCGRGKGCRQSEQRPLAAKIATISATGQFAGKKKVTQKLTHRASLAEAMSGDDYNMEQELAFNREKLGTVVPNRLQGLLEVIQSRHCENDDWYANLSTKILVSVARVCRDLLQTTDQPEALPAAAWNARNLLELWIWIEFCSTSRENARRFHEDALRDALGLTESLRKMSELRGIQNEYLDSARQKLSDIALKEHGIESLDTNYARVASAAGTLGVSPWYEACNAHLSKFAHPTAVLVVGIMHQREGVTALQAACTTHGVFFAGQCVMALERMISKIP